MLHIEHKYAVKINASMNTTEQTKAYSRWSPFQAFLFNINNILLFYFSDKRLHWIYIQPISIDIYIGNKLICLGNCAKALPNTAMCVYSIDVRTLYEHDTNDVWWCVCAFRSRLLMGRVWRRNRNWNGIWIRNVVYPITKRNKDDTPLHGGRRNYIPLIIIEALYYSYWLCISSRYLKEINVNIWVERSERVSD